MSTTSSNYANPTHRCSFCLELLGSTTVDGVIWLCLDESQSPIWKTACYVCLDIVPASREVDDRVFSGYHTTREFTNRLDTADSVLAYIRRMFTKRDAPLWKPTYSSALFHHLGMYYFSEVEV